MTSVQKKQLMNEFKATLVDKIIKLENELNESNECKEDYKIEQVTMLQNEKNVLLEKLEEKEKEIKELKDKHLQIDNIIFTDIEMNNNMIINTVEENNEDSEDEQDLNIVNTDLKRKWFDEQEELLSLQKEKEIRVGRRTGMEQAHKKSGKGGKTGTVKREPMDPKIIEEIFDYTTQTWKDLKDTTPQLMRQAISKWANS
ncbi:hypothetical protein OUZ56_018403 [Daphnia magna]|uniref:Uncharacterized protein n=1 Tax=Daphnia magna TaxID=35525 RepID=A0ABQ9Z8S0_9CRUS|nr:hypothetical protein OUZ56_018403 [Daphnia magna]